MFGKKDAVARQFQLWHGILVVLCPVLFWVVWYLSRPRVKIDYCYRKENLGARGHWLLLTLVCTVAGFILLWKGYHNPWVATVACSLLATSTWIEPLGLPLRLVKEMNGWYYFKGCGPDFLASLATEQPSTPEPTLV